MLVYGKRNEMTNKYVSYSPRNIKPDFLRLHFGDTEESQIILLLELYGKKYSDYGGLDIGIACNRSLVRRRPAPASQNDTT